MKKNIAIFITLICSATWLPILSSDRLAGRVPGRQPGSKNFPLTADALTLISYSPTNAEIKLLRAIEGHAPLNTINEYAEKVDLLRGNFFLVAVQVATQSNNKPALDLIRKLRETQPIARIRQ